METLKHECGVAMVRLLKPMSYYQEKYGTWQYALNKLYLLMEKQHNRGQEGAGIGVVNSYMAPGGDYIYRERMEGSSAIKDLFAGIRQLEDAIPKAQLADPLWASKNLSFAGECLMGHLRYSTGGRSGKAYVHPFLRRSSWKSKSLLLCGNFNLTNVDELYTSFIKDGQHPRMLADTFLMLELLGNNLDKAVQGVYDAYKANPQQFQENTINGAITNHLRMADVLATSSKLWDGGYVICGLTGDANSFAFRDPWGIRTAHYYSDDEIVVLASERAVIQTALNVSEADVHELPAGQAMIITNSGKLEFHQIRQAQPDVHPCSFERIYFSRGSDANIYQERKTLGKQLVSPILKAIDNDLRNTVFSFIPNTAEVAFFGMMEGFDAHLMQIKKNKIKPGITPDELDKILSMRIRQEKVAIKDIKLRTFITEGVDRDELATHVYDITYGSIKAGTDNLVIIDDSIVRGTTLQQSILRILDRLGPKKIVIVSSSPQVRYPDCYGIDMSSMNEFIAFRAAIALLKEHGKDGLVRDVYELCKAQEGQPKEAMINHVKQIYDSFSDEEISAKIAQLLKPASTRAEVEIVFQTVEGLHAACPVHNGDWYFTGNYPTAGGNMSVNKAFIEYYEKSNEKRGD